MITGLDLDRLANQCLKYVKADTARICKPLETMFLIIGFSRNTKTHGGTWTNQNGERIDFDYTEEHVIASGRTPRALYKSAREYQRLCGLSMEKYLREQISRAS